jgi:type IV pilus assembly protein PilC
MDFEYTAIDKDNKRIRAVMSGASAEAVIGSLKTMGFTPLNVKVVAASKEPVLNVGFLTSKIVKIEELVVFTRQLGTILNAGVLLSEALETIATDLENKYFAGLLNEVLSHIRAGESFSSALARHPKVFSGYYVAIVRSGEEIGDMGTVMTNLATYMEDSEKMRQKFVAAIRYPVFLLCFVFCIVSGIVLFLIPRFRDIFAGAGVSLPLLTQIVVGISEFCLHNILFALLGLVVVAILVWHLLQQYKIRFTVDYYLIRLPLIGRVIRKAFLARFCRTTSMLLQGGVGLINALALSADVMNNKYLKFAVEETRRNITGGMSMSEALKKQEAMPNILVKMVAVGEKSGTLSDMIRRMADYYDQEVNTFLNNLNALLEPIFIIFIGAVVLVVALALYLPIFHISAAVH